ncbi:MAG: hypothetical protein ABIJ45_12270 [Candidatus Zixiibacteriota bacterium]
MKSDRVKWITFGGLAIVAAVIWINNLNLFSEQSTYFQIKERNENLQTVDKHQFIPIEYDKPKFNPFSPPKTSKPIKTQDNSKPKKEQNKPQPPKISNQYSIAGLVLEQESPQAILERPNNTNVLISIGDTLDGWIVSSINEEGVILKQDKFADTLLLIK